MSVYQNPVELQGLLEAVEAVHPKAILEIGSLYGGTLFHWMQACPGARVVSIDLLAVEVPMHEAQFIRACRQMWGGWAERFGCDLHTIAATSGHPETLTAAMEWAPYDFIFVDGGHQYLQVSSDFTNYWPMVRKGGLMAFHDIAYPDGSPGIGVGTWWRELVGTKMFRTREFRQSPNTWGIGVIYK